MPKLNKYMSDSYQNFFDNDLSVTDPDLYTSIKFELGYLPYLNQVKIWRHTFGYY